MFTTLLVIIVIALCLVAFLSAIAQPEPDPAIGQLWEDPDDYRVYEIIEVDDNWIVMEEESSHPGSMRRVFTRKGWEDRNFIYLTD